LTIAAQYGRSDIIEMLLNIGAEVNPLHPQGVTAAMLACQGGHVETLKLLIAAGADLESITPHGTTAMGLAEHYKYEEIINLLRQARTHATPGQHDDAKANTTRSGIAHVFKMFSRILNNR
jgi:ankyrin repeat protein